MTPPIWREDDIHVAVASELLGIPREAVTREQRFQHKLLNFRVLYAKSMDPHYNRTPPSRVVKELVERAASNFYTAALFGPPPAKGFTAAQRRSARLLVKFAGATDAEEELDLCDALGLEDQSEIPERAQKLYSKLRSQSLKEVLKEHTVCALATEIYDRREEIRRRREFDPEFLTVDPVDALWVWKLKITWHETKFKSHSSTTLCLTSYLAWRMVCQEIVYYTKDLPRNITEMIDELQYEEAVKAYSERYTLMPFMSFDMEHTPIHTDLPLPVED